MKCHQRLVAEWHLSMFSLKDANDKIIDLDASFLNSLPSPSLPDKIPKNVKFWFMVGILKFLLVVWTLATMVLSILGSRDKNYWLAFLTTWAFLFALWYQLSSFISIAVAFSSSSTTPLHLSLMLGSTRDVVGTTGDAAATATGATTTRDEEVLIARMNPNSSTDNNGHIDDDDDDKENNQEEQQNNLNEEIMSVNQQKMTIWIKLMWALYVIAIHSQFMVTLLYWLLVYDGSSVIYPEIYRHGLLLILVMVDGFIINRIPIRLKQVVFIYAYSMAYLVWTLIHFAADLGNPEVTDTDPDTNDDALYGVLSWRDNPVGAVILCLILILVGLPLIFILTWALSLWVPHRYIRQQPVSME